MLKGVQALERLASSVLTRFSTSLIPHIHRRFSAILYYIKRCAKYSRESWREYLYG